MAVSAREAAVTALGAYRRSGAWSDAYLNGVFKKENMECFREYMKEIVPKTKFPNLLKIVIKSKTRHPCMR